MDYLDLKYLRGELALADLLAAQAETVGRPEYRRLVYQEGGSSLYHGDCRAMAEVATGSVDLIIADPPFNVGFSTYGGGVNDRQKPAAYAVWSREWIQECLRVLVEGGQLYALMPIKMMPWWLAEMKDLWAVHGGHLLVWCKTFAPQLHREATYIRAWEPILWVTKGKRPNVFRREYKYPDDADWLIGSSAVGETSSERWRKGHPTPRPSWLVEALLIRASEPGMTVLDPMMGTGTAARAALKLGRRFIGYDINPDYLKMTAEWLRQQPLDLGPLAERLPEQGHLLEQFALEL
jgi:DNA modification methylase